MSKQNCQCNEASPIIRAPEAGELLVLEVSGEWGDGRLEVWPDGACIWWGYAGGKETGDFEFPVYLDTIEEGLEEHMRELHSLRRLPCPPEVPVAPLELDGLTVRPVKLKVRKKQTDWAFEVTTTNGCRTLVWLFGHIVSPHLEDGELSDRHCPTDSYPETVPFYVAQAMQAFEWHIYSIAVPHALPRKPYQSEATVRVDRGDGLQEEERQ